MVIPDPALVVLVGASGSGKSTWAAQRYRAEEVVSSDALRGVVGSGAHDLDASADAFAVLETIVAGSGGPAADDGRRHPRPRRRSPTALVVAGEGGGPAGGGRALRHPGRGVPTPECSAGPACPGPGAGRAAAPRPGCGCRGRGRGVGPRRPRDGRRDRAEPGSGPARVPEVTRPGTDRTASTGVEVLLQVSRFPWGEDPLAWLRGMALAADEAGFAGLALMDHLIQIPQVGRAWDPIPDPWVTLGAVAALDTAPAPGHPVHARHVPARPGSRRRQRRPCRC